MSAPTARPRGRRRAPDPWPPVTDEPPGAPVPEPVPVPFAAPRPAGAVTWVGVVLAVLLLAVAVVLVHDGLAALGAVGGDLWSLRVADAVGDVEPTWQVALIGAVLALVGLRLVVVALTRRRRPGLPLAAGGGQYLLGGDVARLASGAAAQVDGVLDVTSTWRRRGVSVRATTDGGPGLDAAIRSAVEARLAALAKVPRVDVRIARSRDETGGAR